ncbi:UDP-glucose 4-epimerase [Paenibacillus sambharensis]|uniref:UDP-glucose 4-epimerase n=1 Tax=Paenibacillus sambharensis TaxID=1803190 RepID=A0A2W1LLY0_9BACL|nr:NAD-dependent epimerase/dehydratase family protein [Paenibacillus sambharensis]PZD95524.1 UDP-glucose 4-epimerase [Paenibacillus sambharensis]
MQKILVTGGAGFIGSHIVDRCIEKGHRTIIVDNLTTGKRENVNPEAIFYEADIRSNDMFSIMEKERPDVVIHHAAQIDVQQSIVNPFEDAGINISGTVNLLKASVTAGVRKFIYASSAAVYGPPESLPVTEDHRKMPISFYGVSKYVPEYYIRTFASLHNIAFTILRYANVYGVRQDPKGEGGVISIFLDRMLQNEPLRVFGDGTQTRDFIYVGDIAEANVQAIDHGDGQIVNISTATSVSLNGLIAAFEGVMGRKQEVSYEEARQGDILHSCLDNSLAKEQLAWEPKVNLEEGLRRIYDYYAPLYSASRIEEAKQLEREAREAALAAT